MSWIRKTPTGRYRACFRDPSGTTVSKTFDRSGAATKWLAKQTTRKAEGTYVDPRLGNIRLGQFWPEFLKASPNLRPATENLYMALYRNHIAPMFGHRRLADIRPLDVSTWIDEQLKGGTGAATVNAAFRLLRTMLNKAVRAEYIGRNPCLGVKTPTAGTEEMRFLEAGEVARLACAVPDRYAALIYLLAYGGLRIGEAAALRLEHLDLLRGRVTVAEALSEVNGRIDIGPTKTGAKRTVTLPPTLRELLERHIERYTGRDGFVFPSPDGGPLRPNNFRRRVFAPAVKAAGLAPLRVHDLRHTMAALLIAQGAHVKEIADRLGHSSPMVTMKVYAHLLPGLEERLADGLEATFRAATAASVRPHGPNPVSPLPAVARE